MQDLIDNFMLFDKIHIYIFKVYSCLRVESGLYGIKVKHENDEAIVQPDKR